MMFRSGNAISFTETAVSNTVFTPFSADFRKKHPRFIKFTSFRFESNVTYFYVLIWILMYCSEITVFENR